MVGCLIADMCGVLGGRVGFCFVLRFIVFWLRGFGFLGINEAML